MKISYLFACWVAFSAPSLMAQAPATEESFPFVIPGLAAPPAGSVVDLSWLNDRPAGEHGFVRARDGHFVDGSGKRVRFLATNFTFGSCFPDHDTADKLAMRLASLGINCMRFHHIDNQAAPRGIWKAGTPKKNEFDPDQLDRLDYFIATLKRQGIYADINLHISRNYWEGEDFPDGLASNRERQEKLPNYGNAIDKINDQMIRMQRDYARALLTHVTEMPGGMLRVRLRLDSLEEAERWVLSLGTHATVIRPEKLRERLMRATEELWQRYGGPMVLHDA
jgi:hypothetical protein